MPSHKSHNHCLDLGFYVAGDIFVYFAVSVVSVDSKCKLEDSDRLLKSKVVYVSCFVAYCKMDLYNCKYWRLKWRKKSMCEKDYITVLKWFLFKWPGVQHYLKGISDVDHGISLLSFGGLKNQSHYFSMRGFVMIVPGKSFSKLPYRCSDWLWCKRESS